MRLPVGVIRTPHHRADCRVLEPHRLRLALEEVERQPTGELFLRYRVLR